MKTLTTYKNHCPNAEDYQLYLNQQMEEKKLAAFENHLKECPLCKESIEGYKITLTHNVPRLNKKQSALRNTIYMWGSIAASILILVALSLSWLLNDNLKMNSEELYSDLPILESPEFMQANTGTKRLSHKTEAEYWYYGDNNKVKLNDQIVDKSHITTILETTKSNSPIFIEVATKQNSEADSFVNAVKANKSQPVYTYKSKN
jgi:predicted nucleic acid-binding Zn ribbon protein